MFHNLWIRSMPFLNESFPLPFRDVPWDFVGKKVKKKKETREKGLVFCFISCSSRP